MKDPEAVRRLKALSTAPRSRPSHTARVRAHLDEIEEAQASGASLEQVLGALNEGQGDYAMTLNTLKSALRRVRQERLKGGRVREGGAEDAPQGAPVAAQAVLKAQSGAAPVATEPKGSMAEFFLPRPPNK